MTPGVAPIIKDLTAKQVTADAPFMVTAVLVEPVMAAHQIVNIRNLVRGVIERGRASPEQKERVMVARDRPAIAAQEGAERRLRRTERDLILR